jgi:hypothetical protein
MPRLTNRGLKIKDGSTKNDMRILTRKRSLNMDILKVSVTIPVENGCTFLQNDEQLDERFHAQGL